MSDNPIQELPHLRGIFRHGDDNVKMGLVTRLRDIAIQQLLMMRRGIEPPMSPMSEWSADDVFLFAADIYRADASASTKGAASLLFHCVSAIREGVLSRQSQDWILDAYAALASDAVETGKKFRAGRRPNTGGPIRKAIARALAKNPAMHTRELWTAIAARPPRGWTFCNNRAGEYIEGPRARNMSYRRFGNIASEERRRTT